MENLTLIKFLKKLWCEWTHGGGHIERDELGRINWRCARCGRWSDWPVPLAEEKAMFKRTFKDIFND